MLEGNSRFNDFLGSMSVLIDTFGRDEAKMLSEGRKLVAELVADGFWLPERFRQADSKGFKQYMLYRDRNLRFTVLCVVWNPGQSAPPHDHTIWGIIGQLQGAERSRDYFTPDSNGPMKIRQEEVLKPGETAVVAPSIGDIHDVTNVSDGVSISIHVYGGDLASVASRRRYYDAETGTPKAFVTSYH